NQGQELPGFPPTARVRGPNPLRDARGGPSPRGCAGCGGPTPVGVVDPARYSRQHVCGREQCLETRHPSQSSARRIHIPSVVLRTHFACPSTNATLITGAPRPHAERGVLDPFCMAIDERQIEAPVVAF